MGTKTKRVGVAGLRSLSRSVSGIAGDGKKYLQTIEIVLTIDRYPRERTDESNKGKLLQTDSASGRHQRVGVSLLGLTSFGLRGLRA